ncbi:50S ribosomal protein L3 N(5)-glutamine methyltransferase [Undibacterium oligocarboniphilum]|uniref:Ribosomal protein uL3 glutamine methyltransferase n=1 Tax=Undibacterium oligocarboniphilum TaxID=666702 RepID=A0A850QQK8_9BURK|nr:50S ribosomal protein L3 N(5)-glutamine methyltransferase [Undibacterium oligocarboniphilum]MBC3870355.1 50S ribosomal protein L3 N(5)-glutamine methyltransferase [Undibacterium oligocarboniphilum]NVO78346.1 50S ribosomal protein L3 N(5)-glutamine methyltransferase [Undibacterium oligocarboniphilum]
MPTPATTFKTLRDLLRYAVSRFNQEKLFFGHGSANALDEAAYLLLHSLHLPLDKIDPFMDANLLPHEIDAALRIIERRATDRVPASYITHEAWLGTYNFYVDERVIVPRSFIAELIPEHFSPWVNDPDSISNILELCTGSGCLPIMLADMFQNAHVDAVDISQDALAVAQINVNTYELQDRITLIESDVYNRVPDKKYDLIISNPPYVNSGSMAKLPKEYLHEPQIALAGGNDGMDLVRKIIAGATQRLTEDGILMVEIGNERAFAEAAFPELNLTWVSTSAGDDMVFLIEARDLINFQV